MKGKYMLFAYDDYYPGGGMNDYKFSFNGWHDFMKQIDDVQKFDGYEICDEKLKVVFFKSLEKLLEWVEGLKNDEINVPSWMEGEEAEKEFYENCKTVLKMFENRDKKLSQK